MHIRPGEVKQRKKQRKVESEVSDLRGKLSSCAQSGRNIVLSNREIRLLRYPSGLHTHSTRPTSALEPVFPISFTSFLFS